MVTHYYCPVDHNLPPTASLPINLRQIVSLIMQILSECLIIWTTAHICKLMWVRSVEAVNYWSFFKYPGYSNKTFCGTIDTSASSCQRWQKIYYRECRKKIWQPIYSHIQHTHVYVKTEHQEGCIYWQGNCQGHMQMNMKNFDATVANYYHWCTGVVVMTWCLLHILVKDSPGRDKVINF